MARSQRSGMVQTVLGLVEPERLGITLTHEHLLLDLRPPDKRRDEGWPVTLENSGRNRRHPNENPANARLASVEEAVEELAPFKELGGGALVEATSHGLARDAEGLKRIAEMTELHIVMGSSYYVHAYHPRDMGLRAGREITEEIVRDMTEGIPRTGIRAGIIGEVGLSWPHHPNEEKVLRASVAAQIETGAPLLIHPGRDPRSPHEALRIVREAGGDPKRTIVSHIDRTLFAGADMKALAETGCLLEFDLFGQESSFYAHAPIDMPNDASRIDHLLRLIREGFRDQLVIAHDICHRHGLVRYGGEGYGHILENVVPVMRRKGMSYEELDAILVKNPARVLAFA